MWSVREGMPIVLQFTAGRYNKFQTISTTYLGVQNGRGSTCIPSQRRTVAVPVLIQFKNKDPCTALAPWAGSCVSRTYVSGMVHELYGKVEVASMSANIGAPARKRSRSQGYEEGFLEPPFSLCFRSTTAGQ